MNNKVLIYLLFSMFVLVMNWEVQNHLAVASHHEDVTQEEAIRLRILANSDAVKDQWLKRQIRDEVNAAVTEWVEEIPSIEEAAEIINARLIEIENIVTEVLQEEEMEQPFTVEFNEVYFPTKLYGHLVYPAGQYDAILITLGEGKGENWWCVLFPPLCFLDFANGDVVPDEEEEDEKEESVQVKFFVIEIFSKVKAWFSS